MDADAWMLVLLVVATLAGTTFTVVPVLPAGVFVPLAALIVAVADEQAAIPAWTWIVLVLLAIAHAVIDHVAQLLGVRRIGGSRDAMVGGGLGVLIGPFALALVMGPLALLVGPPAGAVVGTLLGERRARRRVRRIEGADASDAATWRALGIGALLAFIVGTIAKLALVLAQALALLVAIS